MRKIHFSKICFVAERLEDIPAEIHPGYSYPSAPGSIANNSAKSYQQIFSDLK